MRNQYHQISLKDTFSNCQDLFREDTPSFFGFWATLLIFLNSSLQTFTMPFTSLSAANASIPWKASSLPLSFRKSFPSLRILCSSFFLSSAGNYGTSAASPRSRMPLSFPASRPLFNLISSTCSTRWSISRNLSAR